MGADPISMGVKAVSNLGSSFVQSYGQEKVADENAKINLQMNRENIASNEKMFDKNLAFQGEQLGFQQDVDAANRAAYAANRAAYAAALGRGQEQLGTGEQAFMSSVNATPEELGQLKSEILKGQTDTLDVGRRNLSAELSAQGVRGGQAATQMRRGIGEMTTAAQKDINQLISQDALQREAEKRAYLAQKARAGQTATLAGVAR